MGEGADGLGIESCPYDDHQKEAWRETFVLEGEHYTVKFRPLVRACI